MKKNLKFKVLPNGSIKGQTKIVLKSNEIDFSNIIIQKQMKKLKGSESVQPWLNN